MRQAVYRRQMAHHGSDIQVVTISAGVASIAPEGDIEARVLIEAADAGLYAAKAAGRNGVHEGTML
jgi:diguanylate cyclase (GGDEF)-like protein